MRPALTWRRLVIVAVISIVVIGSVVLLSLPRRPSNYGFGSEWKCSSILREPVCFEDQGETRPPLRSN